MRKGLVNALLGVISLSLVSCGFQLQREGATLPNQAETISLESIENKSFRAGLEWELEDRLKQQFSVNRIRLASSAQADLSLKVNLQKAWIHDPNQEDTTSAQYHFIFKVQAQITLADKRSRELVIENEAFTSTYRMELTSSTLSEEEKREGYEMALETLATSIQRRLTTYF